MSGLGARYFASAIVYAILGMGLGLVMGITEDHAQMPTHAHLLVVGWVTFAIFGLFYHVFPSAAEHRLATPQFWLAQASLVLLVVALFAIFSGYREAGLLAALSSTGLLLSMMLFGVIAFPALYGRA